jgi:hypothetical protein
MGYKRSVILMRAKDKKKAQEQREHELEKAQLSDPRRYDDVYERIYPMIEEEE